MKIDIFAHILPPKYFTAFRKKNDKTILEGTEANYPYVVDLDLRLRLMNRYPDVLQVLTVALQNLLETVPDDDVELSRIANDELAEIIVKYPDKFYAAAACLPPSDIDEALKETDRAITELGLKGVQISSRINGESLDNPKFRPLFEKMAKYDLPIWIHPSMSPGMMDGGVFGLVYETSCAMQCLVSCGIMEEFPNIKVIAHHTGAIVPLLEGRLLQKELFRKFYGDTATYGSTIQIMCGYSFFGADHILFGTDTPLGPKHGCTLDVIQAVERMPVPEEDKEKIFLHNARNLLGIQL